MKRDSVKKFYIVHSWVGVITGILLFVICLTGALSVFGSPELKLWANPALHTPLQTTPQQLEELLIEEAENIPAEFFHEVRLLMPGAQAFGNLLLAFTTEHGADEQAILLEYDPQTLELINRAQGGVVEAFNQRQKNMESFLTGFHADLHLDRLGMMMTGLLGLTLMASIVTGVIIHRKILKELFTFRPLRSIRLLLTDSHKALSVWGILFHGMIGFTGAFLGLATIILLPAAAYVSFQGDQDKLIETFVPERMPALSGAPASMQVAAVLEELQQQPGTVRSLTIMGWGDANALGYADVFGGDSMATQVKTYTMADAQYQGASTSFELVGGVSGPVLDLMFPLHFGNFGGLPVKIVWALLGLSTSLIAVTGIMIWIERRAYGAAGTLKPHTYLRLSKLTTGSCAGLLLACASLFYSQRLAPELVVPMFFCVWLIAILWSFWQSNDYRSNRQLLGLTGLMLLAIPVLDAAILEHHLFNSWNANHRHFATIEACLMMLGIAMIALVRKLPTRRPEEHHRKQVTQQNHRQPSSDDDTLDAPLNEAQGNS